VYEFECPNGHRTTTILRTPKHEVLYAIGANAYLDGYLRESIASFAASLERYYEFALRVIARHKGIEPDEFVAVWNLMSKYSERQYGAFMMAWTLESGKFYTSISPTQISKMIKLRNQVIHEGKLPTADQCMKYGQYVLDIVSPIEKVLHAEYGSAHKDQCFANFDKVKTTLPEPRTVLSIYSVFEKAIRDDGKLEPAIKKLEDVRKLNNLHRLETDFSRGRIVKQI
jgi:hypothetical protein